MDTTAIGLFTSDGFFQAFENMTQDSSGYFFRTEAELTDLLQKKINLEEYEECARIRDELKSRNKNQPLELS